MSYHLAEWRESGACVTVDPDLFFPAGNEAVSARQADQARRICAGCHVRSQCLQFAVDFRESYGIWGGTTPEERERVRRKAAGARHYAARALRRAASVTAA